MKTGVPVCCWPLGPSDSAGVPTELLPELLLGCI